jgi:hypothetical protein
MAMLSRQSVKGATLCIILYNIALVIYISYFHPPARFPGPKAAAATQWWECFQDLFGGQGGDYMNQVDHMHDEYGAYDKDEHLLSSLDPIVENFEI